MAQFGNRMFGGAVPGLLGGISDMMARYPRNPNGVEPGPGFNRQMSPDSFNPTFAGRDRKGDFQLPPGAKPENPIAWYQQPPGRGQPMPLPGGPTNYPGIERPMPPTMQDGGSMTVGNEFHTGTMPMPDFQRPNRPAFNLDLSQIQNLPAFMQPGGPTNYPGIERPMPPMGGPTNYPGIERPMPPMGGSVGAGKRPPGIGPIGGGMFPGGERPGTYGRPVRPGLKPRDPRGLMRGM